VFDLGAGKLDVALFVVDSGIVEMKASSNCFLL
jgi:hypothetical protein